METLYFAQLSDIHISTLGDHHDMLSGRSADFTREIFAHLNQLDDLDFVLFSGDLFDAPTQQNLAVFQEIIQQLTRPYFIIPGNHDRRNVAEVEGLTLRQFAQLFNPQFKDRPATPEAQAGYWSLPVSPGIQLIGLDSVRNENWGGIIDTTQVEWLKSELKTQADKFVILTLHHPLHKLAPIDDHPNYRYFVCDNGPEMIELLDRHPQVKLVLTGHHHQTKADLLGRRLHLACPALSVYPCAYRTLRLTQSGSGDWQIEWQTHPATDEATIAESLERMVQTWQEVGFASDFVQTHVELAWGSERDRQGVVRL